MVTDFESLLSRERMTEILEEEFRNFCREQIGEFEYTTTIEEVIGEHLYDVASEAVERCFKSMSIAMVLKTA